MSLLLLFRSGAPANPVVAFDGTASTTASGTSAVVRVERLPGSTSTEASGTISVVRVLGGVSTASTETSGSLGIVRLVRESGTGSTEASGTETLTRTLALAGSSSTETAGTPRLVLVVGIPGTASEEASGTPGGGEEPQPSSDRVSGGARLTSPRFVYLPPKPEPERLPQRLVLRLAGSESEERSGYPSLALGEPPRPAYKPLSPTARTQRARRVAQRRRYEEELALLVSD